MSHSMDYRNWTASDWAYCVGGYVLIAFLAALCWLSCAPEPAHAQRGEGSGPPHFQQEER